MLKNPILEQLPFTAVTSSYVHKASTLEKLTGLNPFWWLEKLQSDLQVEPKTDFTFFPYAAEILEHYPDTLKQVRKVAIQEKSFWLAEKKSLPSFPGYAKYAKLHERMWLRREKACTELLDLNKGTGRDPILPEEHTSAFNWAISEALQLVKGLK